MTSDASKDQNDVSTLLGVSNADGTTPVKIWASPSTHRLLVDTSGGGGTPGSPDNSVQYNNGGTFGGTTLLYTEGSIPDAVFTTANATGNDDGGNINFGPGDGSGSGAGGGFIFGAGDGGATGSGGDMAFSGGTGGATSGSGGSLSLTAGSSQGTSSAGGGITIAAGVGTGDDGGSVQANGGNDGNTNGALFRLEGGSSSQAEGGNVVFQSGGISSGIGDAGSINFTADNGGPTSGSGGSLNLIAGSAQGGTSLGGGVTIRGGNSIGAAQAGNIILKAGGTGGGFQQTTGGVDIVDGENNTGFQSVRKILTYTGATTTFTVIPSTAIAAGKNASVLIEIRASVVVNQNSEGVAEGAAFVRRASFASTPTSGFIQLGSTQEVYTEVDTDTSAVNLTIQLSTGNISTTLTNGNAGTVQWVCEVFYIISTITHI